MKIDLKIVIELAASVFSLFATSESCLGFIVVDAPRFDSLCGDCSLVSFFVIACLLLCQNYDRHI